jgi:predicted TIM-barrel fold metal-dependent hydrolase
MSLPLIEYGRQGKTVDDFPILDAHAHLHSMLGCDALPLEEQVREMDRCGIRMTMVSSTLAIAADFTQGNDQVADAVRRFPGRFLGYCHVSAVYPELMLPELERCFRNPGFRGIKVYQVGPAYDSPLYDPVWAFAKAHHAPVLAHTWGGNLTGFDTAAEKNPDVNFLAAHAGSGFAYQPYIDAAKRVPNLFLDLTYSREHTNMIETIVAAVGPDQIVWGSDAPVFSMAHQLGKVLFARIPDEAKRKILGGTAARVLGLDLKAGGFPGMDRILPPLSGSDCFHAKAQRSQRGSRGGKPSRGVSAHGA